MKKLVVMTIIAASCFSPVDADDSVDQTIELNPLDAVNEGSADAILGSINPLDNDLRGLEVAIRMRKGFRLKPNGAVFEFGVIDGTGETRLDEAFTLIETQNVQHASLTKIAQTGFAIRTYKLNEADHGRMNAGDRLLQDLKQKAPGQNELTFNANAYPCADPGVDTPNEYRLAMFVRTAKNVGFVPLSNGDIVLTRAKAGPLSFAWEPCED